jgi:hypothetical protein
VVKVLFDNSQFTTPRGCGESGILTRRSLERSICYCEEKASPRRFDTIEQIRTLLRLKITIEQPKSEQQSA